MNVIVHSTDGVYKDTFFLADTCNVRPHPWLEFFFDQATAFFRAEHHMDYILRVCVRQCVTPPGFYILYAKTFPPLAGWANFRRASGAPPSALLTWDYGIQRNRSKTLEL